MSGKAVTPRAKPAPRTTIAVQGARVHNLKNVSLELPRDKLIVVTGLSGSGKSSLAFDTIYAEGQRRYLESLSSFAKRFVSQVAKPDVDFVFGLSPVISIEQKTTGSNPRSTVGTMTDIASYLNLLFATIAEPHCPRTGESVLSRSANQILEAILSLPKGAEIEMRAPVFKVYGEELDFVFTEVRKKGCRQIVIDGRRCDISDKLELDEDDVRDMDAVVDRFVVGPLHEKAIKAGIAATLLVGDGLMQVEVLKGATKSEGERFYKALCSPTHHFVYGGIEPEYFMFNNPESACRTCGGLGIYKITHPELLVPDPKRSLRGGCFVKEAYKYNPDTWDGRIIYSLSKVLGFSLDTPWEKLPESVRNTILYGLDGKKLATSLPPDAKVKRDEFQGHEVGFHGIARRIERQYRRYRQRGEASSGMEAWLDKVMVERTCPDCNGARLRATRQLFTVAGKTIYDVGNLHFDELYGFLGSSQAVGPGQRRGTAGAERNPRPAEAVVGNRARLFEPESPLGHALGRRIAAHSPLHADRFGPDGHAVRARRAEYRASSQGQRQDDRHARKPARHRQHRDRGGARRGHHPLRGSHRRDGPGARRPWRAGGGTGGVG